MISSESAKINKLRNRVKSLAKEYGKAKNALDKAEGNYFDHASYFRRYYGYPHEQAAEREKERKGALDLAKDIIKRIKKK